MKSYDEIRNSRGRQVSEESLGHLNYLKEVVNNPDNFVAGKIKQKFKFWKTITKDKEILSYVNGVAVNFQGEPPTQSVSQREFNFSQEERLKIREEIKVFIKKGIIREIKSNSHQNDIQFVTNIFLRMKPDGSFRTILNLKEFNKIVSKIHFKMETLRSTLTLIRKDCFFASIDLKDAYHSCPVKEEDKKYFRFQFEERLFEYQCLPQGYTDSPRIFTKLTKPLMATLRSQGFSNSIYIDDILLTGDSQRDIENNVIKTIKLFDDAGFTIHPRKSVFKGTKVIEFLGFIIDSEKLSVKPTADKSKKIVHECNEIMHKRTITIQTLSEIVGKLVALEPGNLYAKLYYKRLENFKNKMLKKYKGNYKAKVRLDDDCKEDLKWWCENTSCFPKPINQGKINHTLKCDASSDGWGIYNESMGTTSGGLWSDEERKCHINELELMAVKICLQTFCKEYSNCHVHMFSDNSTAVSCLNKMGSGKDKINALVRDIWLWCKDKNIFITVSHICGILNVESDTESRKYKPELEWSLSDKIFSVIQSKFVNMSIDLFASRLNNKLEKYCSWKPDPHAIAINSFHLNWGSIPLGYCFPPFCLIPYVLQKVEHEAADIVLIAPLWPTQLWFPKLLSLLIECPTLLPTKDDLLVNPVNRRMKHPLREKLKLVVWRLSGIRLKTLDFQSKLPLCSWPPGEVTPPNNITPILRNGSNIVMKGKSIQMKRI